MSPRLIILIVAAGGMAVYLAVRPPAPVTDTLIGVPPPGVDGDIDPTLQIPIWNRPLDGEEPPEVPELEIRVEVDPSGAKNRLHFYIDEAHGYYVEAPKLRFWYVSEPGQELEDSPLSMKKIVNDYIRANQTFQGCIDVVPAELQNVGDDIGTDENWRATVESWGRARTQDPDPLPATIAALSCD